jgi:hypothetical protein
MARSSAHYRVPTITDAALSHSAQLAVRKRRYEVVMGLRVAFLAAAALSNTQLLAVVLLGCSLPLPWMAVLMANDRLPVPNRRRAGWLGGGGARRPGL